MQIATSLPNVSFSTGEWVTYPAHGVGRVKAIETMEHQGTSLRFFKIEFHDPFLIVRVPLEKAHKNGLRKIGKAKDIEKALKTLKEVPSAQKGLWIHRFALYEKKIASGALMDLAEILRDLKHLKEGETLSYSERKLWENAFGRMVQEASLALNISLEKAQEKVQKLLR